jgi:hypothetical protein
LEDDLLGRRPRKRTGCRIWCHAERVGCGAWLGGCVLQPEGSGNRSTKCGEHKHCSFVGNGTCRAKDTKLLQSVQGYAIRDREQSSTHVLRVRTYERAVDSKFSQVSECVSIQLIYGPLDLQRLLLLDLLQNVNNQLGQLCPRV